MRKKLLILAIAIVVNSMFVQTFSAQTAKSVDFEKVRKKLVKILRRKENGVKVKLNNGQTIKGRLTAVDVDFFTLIENKSKATKNINFSDIKKVKKHTRYSTKDKLGIAGVIGFFILYGIRGAN